MNHTVDEIITTTCASHCGGSCILRLHVKDGVIVHIETDDADEPQLRACLRGRAYRQRLYDPNRILYPLKRVGERGEGKFVRISWDEAIDTVAREIVRVRDTYGPASILYLPLAGDLGQVHGTGHMARVLAMAGGYTMPWGQPSFHAGIYALRITYGAFSAGNTRDDLLNSRLILLWGWNPAGTVAGVNTNWYLAQAREKGIKIVAIDPRYTDSAATFAHQWIPIRPATDGAMLLAMAYVMLEENLHDRKFLDRYTTGFDKFKDYLLGVSDGVPKTPGWAEQITGVPAETIVSLAREYAATKPSALLSGVAPGRTANGEQYHRIAITLGAMTGNIGLHGGDASARAWESITSYPYKVSWGFIEGLARNPVDREGPPRRKGDPWEYKASRVHRCEVPDFIEKGRAGGFRGDCKLIAVVNFSYLNAMPNVNRIATALKSEKLEFLFVLEQVMTPTAKFADIILPTNTYMERDDLVRGAGLPFYGLQRKAVQPLGESKSHNDIATLLAKRLGLTEYGERTDEDWIREMVAVSEIPNYEEFKEKGIYRLEHKEPFVAFKQQIEDPENNPFDTPSGKIEIYSQWLAELNDPELPPLPTYVDAWEGWNDPLRTKYPLQMISTHFKRRANNQFHEIPWLAETETHAVLISGADAEARGIKDGELVRVFNDRGEVLIPARVTERIMPGVVDVPHGAWYQPDEKGIDRGGCPNVLTKDKPSPGGAFAYNSCLVEIRSTRPDAVQAD